MKRILTLLFMTLILIACSSNKYIDAIKQDTYAESIVLEDFEIRNTEDLIVYYIKQLTEEDEASIRSDLKYELSEKLDETSVIVNAKSKKVVVSIPVKKDGDEYEIKYRNIVAMSGDKIYDYNTFMRDHLISNYNKGIKDVFRTIEEIFTL